MTNNVPTRQTTIQGRPFITWVKRGQQYSQSSFIQTSRDWKKCQVTRKFEWPPKTANSFLSPSKFMWWKNEQWLHEFEMRTVRAMTFFHVSIDALLGDCFKMTWASLHTSRSGMVETHCYCVTPILSSAITCQASPHKMWTICNACSFGAIEKWNKADGREGSRSVMQKRRRVKKEGVEPLKCQSAFEMLLSYVRSVMSAGWSNCLRCRLAWSWEKWNRN